MLQIYSMKAIDGVVISEIFIEILFFIKEHIKTKVCNRRLYKREESGFGCKIKLENSRCI